MNSFVVAYTRIGSGLRRLSVGWLLLSTVWIGALSAQQLLPAADVRLSPDTQAPIDTKPSDASAKRLWHVSLLALSTANLLDVHSSLGKRELNSTLAGPTGTFGAQGILLKSAFQGGLVGIEYLVTRGHAHGFQQGRPRSKLYRGLAIVNFATAAVLAGTAAHNYTIPRTSP